MRRAGFTLLEIMVTLVIVATTLVALQSVVTDNLDGVEAAIQSRTVRTLARQKLEEYVSEGATGSNEGTFDQPELASYRYRITSEPIAVDETRSITKLRIEVSAIDDEDPGALTNGSADPRRVTLTTYVPSVEEQ
jgi:prepilin-type N-terminal cleavage/methylation domain-containing protein